MRKIFYLLIGVIVFNGNGYAQKVPASSLTAKDSADILSELMTLMDSSDKATSYVFANIGVGNRLFSVKNYALNAKQSSTAITVFTPSVEYFHKSGFSLAAAASLLNDATGFGATQYAITPAFDLMGNKDIAFGISYAHYFVKNKFSSLSSPVQNDLYASFIYKKPWLRPGIAVGYATGVYKEARHKDTTLINTQRHLYDSVTNHLKSFSLMLSAGHQFLWYGLLTKSDGLSLTVTAMGNAGSSRTGIHHNTNAAALFNFLNKRGRIPKFQNSSFEFQSVGLNIDLNYSIGDFTIEPQLYSDYYLPNTESKRFTQVFVFNVGYSF